MKTLDELGYDVANSESTGADDPKVIDGRHFRPQHRERIVLIGFRRDLRLKDGFTLRDIKDFYPDKRPSLRFTGSSVDSKYILSLNSGSTYTTMQRNMRQKAMVLVLD